MNIKNDQLLVFYRLNRSINNLQLLPYHPRYLDNQQINQRKVLSLADIKQTYLVKTLHQIDQSINQSSSKSLLGHVTLPRPRKTAEQDYKPGGPGVPARGGHQVIQVHLDR